MDQILINAKKVSEILGVSPQGVRSDAIRGIASGIRANMHEILSANTKDVTSAKNTISAAMLDRLTLDVKQIESIATAAEDIAAQPDPVGEVISGGTRPNGLRIIKTRVPLGVIGIIYESRPNVTVDCAALCLRSANVCILRGGKEAYHTNRAFADIIEKALCDAGLPREAVILLEDADRTKMQRLITANKLVDLIIPRGGEGLIKYITENSTIPIVKHDKGVCHIYADKTVDIQKAIDIIRNAKTSRPSACNAVEALLVHVDIAEKLLPALKDKMPDVELRGCERTAKIIHVKNAVDTDWGMEYLDLTMAVKIVDTLEDAINYINKYSSGHSDAILTDSYANAERFLSSVDSACVYVNASTRFTDGGEFGLGAEVGISTQKLHSRGPMGAFDLTTIKYIIHGEGQIR